MHEIRLEQTLKNPLTDVDCIELLIKREMSERQYGWVEHLRFFKGFRREMGLAGNENNF